MLPNQIQHIILGHCHVSVTFRCQLWPNKMKSNAKLLCVFKNISINRVYTFSLVRVPFNNCHQVLCDSLTKHYFSISFRSKGCCPQTWVLCDALKNHIEHYFSIGFRSRWCCSQTCCCCVDQTRMAVSMCWVTLLFCKTSVKLKHTKNTVSVRPVPSCCDGRQLL